MSCQVSQSAVSGGGTLAFRLKMVFSLFILECALLNTMDIQLHALLLFEMNNLVEF